jgi:hypothetical protein
MGLWWKGRSDGMEETSVLHGKEPKKTPQNKSHIQNMFVYMYTYICIYKITTPRITGTRFSQPGKDVHVQKEAGERNLQGWAAIRGIKETQDRWVGCTHA